MTEHPANAPAPRLSFEFFPPRTEGGQASLGRVAEKLNQLHPAFFSCTYGAGGSTREGTCETVKQLLEMGIDAAPHLSIGADSEEETSALLDLYRDMGVKRIVAVAFRRETRPDIESCCDEVTWVYLGQLGHMLRALEATGTRVAVMAGQITPTHLFRMRMDAELIDLLRRLPERNAETIFSAIGDALASRGIERDHGRVPVPPHGQLGTHVRRSPRPTEHEVTTTGIVVPNQYRIGSGFESHGTL